MTLGPKKFEEIKRLAAEPQAISMVEGDGLPVIAGHRIGWAYLDPRTIALERAAKLLEAVPALIAEVERLQVVEVVKEELRRLVESNSALLARIREALHADPAEGIVAEAVFVRGQRDGMKAEVERLTVQKAEVMLQCSNTLGDLQRAGKEIESLRAEVERLQRQDELSFKAAHRVIDELHAAFLSVPETTPAGLDDVLLARHLAQRWAETRAEVARLQAEVARLRTAASYTK